MVSLGRGTDEMRNDGDEEVMRDEVSRASGTYQLATPQPLSYRLLETLIIHRSPWLFWF